MGSTRTQLRLGPARRSDAAWIARMSRDLVENGLPWSWTPRRVTRHIDHAESMVLTARLGEFPVGFAIMTFAQSTAHLNLLAVRPDLRRQGIARRLIQWLEKSARVAGTFQIGVEVRRTNHAARSLYRRLGYRELAHLPGYYFQREDAVRLTRDLRVARRDHQ